MAWKLMPVKLPPGMFRNGTHYESKGRWNTGNLVRWFNGVLRPIGGWLQGLNDNTVTGMARAGLSWKLNDGGRRLALATETKLYGWNGGSLSDITPAGYTAGREDTVQGFGYGSGIYGAESYGTQRTTGTALTATTWSLDLWGEKLVGVASHEGTIYEWNGSGASVATAISGAPTAGALFVTPERILVALAASADPRYIKWSDSEDNTQWVAASTNQAGDHYLATQGEIMTGVRVAGGQSVILTTSDVWVMTYLGPPWIYGFEKVGQDCGVVGKVAHVLFDGRVAWMSQNQFWMYDGNVRPIPCEVSDYVFGDINLVQKEKIHTGHLPRFNEVWWWYPSSGSDEPNRYVIWNYRENHWATGELDRTCWVDDNGVWGQPFAVASDGKAYEHENGFTNDGVDRADTVYAQSGPVEIGQGGRMLWVNQVIPDEDTQGDVRMRIYTRFAPNDSAVSHGPYTVGTNDLLDVRLQGRSIAFRIEEVDAVDWRWGVPRLRAEAGSGR
jgi:hypothetical protein